MNSPNNNPKTPSAAVVITAKNRLDDLRKAVASALIQTVRPKVLVMDDGSTDGSAEMIAREYPQAEVVRSETSLGYIVQRNHAAQMVSAEIIFSIDDDAVFSSPHVMEKTLSEFNHPRVGAVAIPFVDVNRGLEIKQRAPDPQNIYATYTYIGTAHAVRRELFLALGGYQEALIHQGEEEDFCTRLLNAGYVTRCGNADPIHHFESPRRSWTRMDFYGSRNKIIYCWRNVPLPFLSGHLAVTSVKTLAHTWEPRRLGTRLNGVLRGYSFSLTRWNVRKPVATGIYRLTRELKRRRAIPLAEIESRLPALNLHAPDL